MLLWRIADFYLKIAEGLYETDPLFNLLFLNDKIRAITGIERLIESKYSNPYHKRFIMLLYDEEPENVKGFITGFKGTDISTFETIHAFYDTSCTDIMFIIGFSALDKILSSNISRDDFYIGNIYVYPEFRNNDYGSKLVERMKQEAAQSYCKNVLLDVDCNKAELIEFYEKLGFEVDSKHYYGVLNKKYGCYGLKCELNKEE